MLGGDISMFEVNGGGGILSTKAEFVCTEMCGTGVLVGIRAVWLHICAILACSKHSLMIYALNLVGS